jgi:pimeloyl-ACP methyl ester carboxylesterase
VYPVFGDRRVVSRRQGGECVSTLDEATGHGDVIGGSGVRLAVHTAGPVDAPPVVLLHGWAQSARAWQHQLTGDLTRRFRLIAADLRGHGRSDAPTAGYDSTAAWAADVRALLTLAGRPAVLVGWSYGGLVITDYLRTHGTDGVAGIVFAGAISEIGRGGPGQRHVGGRIGPTMRAALPDSLSPDPAVADPALRTFVAAMPHNPLPAPYAATLVEETLRVPAAVRTRLFARDVASAEVLAGVDVPTLVLHGREDTVVDPCAAEYTARLVPGATSVWFDNVGHLPFAERPAEFDTVLADHAERAIALVGRTA